MGEVVNEPAYALRISIAGALASVLFSTLHVLFDPLLNPDGVVYLLTAQAWLDNGYAAAAATFPMPVYSILIAVVHELTGLSLLTSARCLDATLIAILVVGLQRLTWALGGGTRTQLIVVVLALMLPELNGYRSFLIRDFGYWALATLALTCLVRYADAPDTKRAVAFFLICLAAAAFRLEAIPFLLLMPIALIFGQERRPGAATALYIAPAIALAAVGLITAAWPGPARNGQWLASALQTAIAVLMGVPRHIQAELEGFSSHVLDPGFADYAGFGLAGGLVTMIFVHVANAASLPVLAIAGIGIARGTLGTLQRRASPLLWTAFAIVLLGLAAVLGSRGIIQTRYAMPAGFLILVIAAFVVDDWYTRTRTPQARVRLRWATVLVLVYFLAEAGFALLNSKQHYLATAEWLERNTAPSTRIYSNDPRVVYLADRTVDGRDLNSAQRPNERALPDGRYDYLALYITRDDLALRQFADSEPRWQRVAQFTNRQGDGFVIYHTHGLTTPSGRDP